MGKLQVILVAVFAFAGALLTGSTASAAVRATTETASPGSVRAVCSGPIRVDFGMGISNVDLNVNTGRVSYTVTVKYQKCDARDTRAYAIFNSSNRYCPHSGTYGQNGDVYDCAKYVGNPAFQADDTSLSCAEGTNWQCVDGGRNSNIVIEAVQPPAGGKTMTFNKSFVIANWNTLNDRSRSSYRITNGSMCQYFKYDTNNSGNFNRDTDGNPSLQRCVRPTITVGWEVTPDYDITHSQTPPPATVYPGNTVSFGWTIRNNGPEAVPASLNLSGQRDVIGAANWTRGNVGAARSCNRTNGMPANATLTTCSNNFTVPENAVVGTRYCQRLTYRPNNSENTGNTNSSEMCTTVVEPPKAPKLQVRGGDVRVHDGGITTSTSRFSGRTYGSWTEYGAVSSGVNAVFGSGAGLLMGNTSDAATPSAWSRLTFANVNTTGITALGDYALGVQTSGLRGLFAGLDAENRTGNFALEATGGSRVLDFGSGNVTLTGATGITGSYVIRTTGTVTITSNIELNDTLSITNLANMPQVAIVAGDIIINPEVSRVDAWLLADDEITTCRVASPPVDGDGLTRSTCNTPLTINGPVQARKLHPYRTAGGERAAATAAAETINLPGYTYLWARQLRNDPQSVITTYTTELPPRF